jgi:hypothetical protein
MLVVWFFSIPVQAIFDDSNGRQKKKRAFPFPGRPVVEFELTTPEDSALSAITS